MAPPRTAQDRAVGQSRSPLDVAALELLATRGWHGGDEAPLGEWLLRAGGGFTGVVTRQGQRGPAGSTPRATTADTPDVSVARPLSASASAPYDAEAAV